MEISRDTFWSRQLDNLVTTLAACIHDNDDNALVIWYRIVCGACESNTTLQARMITRKDGCTSHSCLDIDPTHQPMLDPAAQDTDSWIHSSAASILH